MIISHFNWHLAPGKKKKCYCPQSAKEQTSPSNRKYTVDLKKIYSSKENREN
uniref:Uncharacterized protein n=1 Tax=Arundo donax TaxID=35708 RepID=A0A0A9RA91_ARUDO